MKVRLAGLLATFGGELVFAPLLLDQFEGTLEWPHWGFYLAGALCLAAASILHRDKTVKAHFDSVSGEVISFYSRYPWRPISAMILVSFLITVIVADRWLDLSSPQVAALGLALWGIPYVLGEAGYGGRRRSGD